jgi:phage terminase small subunit
MALTDKQARFVEEYLVDLNATQAATRAGFSAKTAKQQGAQLLGKPEIGDAIAAAKAARSEKAGINAAWVLKRLAEWADADIADLHDDAGNLKPVKEWPAAWRKGLVAGIEVEELFEGRGEDRKHIGRVRKVKIADRTKHLELIGKHVDVQAFKEKVEHEGALTLTPSISVNGKPG